MNILRMLGLAPTEDDKRLRELIRRSYRSIKVVGRGTVRIDPHEVRQSPEFKQALGQAKAIVHS